MKKERDDSRLLSLKITRIMKITAILILAGILQVSAVTYAQEHRISVAVENGTFYDVVSQIEKQSEFMFFYKSEEIDNNQRFNLAVKNKLVSEILSEITRNNSLTYKIVDKHIIITKQISVNPIKRVVTGIIKDTNGEPIIGANVIEKGTTNGTVTDIDGKFSLSVDENSMLEVSYIGYITQLISQKDCSEICLKENTQFIDEVVVVGYGTQKKANLTGAVTMVSSEDLSKKMVGQSSMALQGVMPGVTVTQTSGQPGKDGGTIRIRGIGTLNNSDPLVLVDGMEMGINNVDPNLIESISVLKDAASSAIYGSRAANGVILITTKRAKTGEFSVSYSGYAGWQNPTDLRDPVDAVSHMQMMNIANVNVGKSPVFSEEQINNTIKGTDRDNYPNTDWQKLIYNGSGFQQSHFLTLNGGSEKMRVLAAIGYYDQTGIVDNTNYKRYTASEVENIMDSANGAVVSVSLKDKLSDSGIIGTCVLKKNDNKAIVEECFVSCRALGRGLDEAIILGAIQRGITFLNIDRIYVEFKKGDRNLPAEKFYKEYFEKQNMTETRFSYEIPRNYIEFETVIK